MKNEKLIAVLTTIQEPTDCVRRLSEVLNKNEVPLLVVGDRKGPRNYDLPGVEFFNMVDQLQSPFELAKLLPENHYSRKNLGYLLAMAKGATSIYETDDDNKPLTNWSPRSSQVGAMRAPETEWCNVYSYFSEEKVWPRGFPLDWINRSEEETPQTSPLKEELNIAPIQQGLANGSPDVDAIWRLTLDNDITFLQNASVLIPERTWCPFNSQSTWWWPEAFLLLYLPSFCSFRMTDIWRSFIAQRCLWELGYNIVFHGPEVLQERNVHNLMKDFQDEIPGYLGNSELIKQLNQVKLKPGIDNIGSNLKLCYECLVEKNFFPEDELTLVKAWVEDVKLARSGTL